MLFIHEETGTERLRDWFSITQIVTAALDLNPGGWLPSTALHGSSYKGDPTLVLRR